MPIVGGCVVRRSGASFRTVPGQSSRAVDKLTRQLLNLGRQASDTGRAGWHNTHAPAPIRGPIFGSLPLDEPSLVALLLTLLLPGAQSMTLARTLSPRSHPLEDPALS